jgi:hypothetical protein
MARTHKEGGGVVYEVTVAGEEKSIYAIARFRPAFYLAGVLSKFL